MICYPWFKKQRKAVWYAVVGNNAALAVNINNLNLDDIFEWYQSINKSEYHYPEELARIQNDDKSFEEKVLAFARN